MRRSAQSSPSINFRAMVQKVEVDNRISLRNYSRVADNIIKQANIHREEKNLIDLYVVLLRYSSLVTETIPYHQDYKTLSPREKKSFRKKLLSALNELETLKPEVRRLLHELKKVNNATHEVDRFDGRNKRASSVSNGASIDYSHEQICSGDDEAHRLTESAELTVPPESSNEYCEAHRLTESVGLTVPPEYSNESVELTGPPKYSNEYCEAHRLTERAELTVPPEYSNGPCLIGTNRVLDFIDGILRQFIFYNEAALIDVRETIDQFGCSYGSKRGKHIQAKDSSKNKVLYAVIIAFLMMMMIGWRMLL